MTFKLTCCEQYSSNLSFYSFTSHCTQQRLGCEEFVPHLLMLSEYAPFKQMPLCLRPRRVVAVPTVHPRCEHVGIIYERSESEKLKGNSPWRRSWHGGIILEAF